jgi:hypothetical protein
MKRNIDDLSPFEKKALNSTLEGYTDAYKRSWNLQKKSERAVGYTMTPEDFLKTLLDDPDKLRYWVNAYAHRRSEAFVEEALAPLVAHGDAPFNISEKKDAKNSFASKEEEKRSEDTLKLGR